MRFFSPEHLDWNKDNNTKQLERTRKNTLIKGRLPDCQYWSFLNGHYPFNAKFILATIIRWHRGLSYTKHILPFKIYVSQEQTKYRNVGSKTKSEAAHKRYTNTPHCVSSISVCFKSVMLYKWHSHLFTYNRCQCVLCKIQVCTSDTMVGLTLGKLRANDTSKLIPTRYEN